MLVLFFPGSTGFAWRQLRQRCVGGFDVGREDGNQLVSDELRVVLR